MENKQEKLNRLVKEDVKQQVPGLGVESVDIQQGVDKDIMEININEAQGKVVLRVEMAPGTEKVLKRTWILKKDGEDKIIRYDDVAALESMTDEDRKKLSEADFNTIN